MSNSKVSDWLQIAASVGVFVGLLLVAFEIRESNRVATSESVGAMNQAWMDFYLAGAGPNITGLLRKSYEEPHNLTSEDMMRLVHYYDSILALYTWHLRAYELETAEFNPIPDFAAEAVNYFGSPFGRAYLEFTGTWARPELISAAKVAIGNIQQNDAPQNLVHIRDIMRQQLEETAQE